MRSYIFIWISSSQTWDTMSSEVSQFVEQKHQDWDIMWFEEEDVYVWYYSKEQRHSQNRQQVKWLIRWASKNCFHLKQ